MNNQDYKAKYFYQKPEVAKSYDEVRFGSWHGWLAHRSETRTLELMIKRYFEPKGSVLDVPCGTGRLMGVEVDEGYQVTGGDISEEMLKIARHRFFGSRSVTFQRVDVQKLPFANDFFDYLVSYRFMCHLPPEARRAALEEMLRVTKKVLVINYYFKNNSPLGIFNRVFRKNCCPPYPLSRKVLVEGLEQFGVELLEVRYLTWYERSSALVVLRKISEG